MAIDYKDKIRKLLALSESPNEGEARAAMLKAQELMVKHKLSEADLGEPVDKTVIQHCTEITCSKRREPWIIGLAKVVGDNYCCYGVSKHAPGQQTRYVGFAGLRDDVDICVSIFSYAVDCVRASIQQLKKDCHNPPASYFAPVANSYGFGFVVGLEQKFAEQKAKNAEWGLVLVKPKEVTDAMKGMKQEAFHSAAQENINRSALMLGYDDGKQFNPATRLQAG